MLEGNRLALPLALALVFLFGSFRFSETRVPKDEVDALQKMASTMGARYWQFDADSCKLELVGLTRNPPRDSEKSLDCECHLEASRNVCHVVRIVLKRFDLPGVLPPELVKLPYLREIDFAYNYLNGTIPTEWASTNLTSISVLGNRLSGEIPKELGELMNLTYLCLEANQFTGSVPFEIGNLINLTTLMLSSNQFNGTLPPSLKGLINLTDFRINDNNFNGAIPDFIQNWRQLTRLEMQGSGLSGPIPSNVSLLVKLTDLRISDISGASQKFPMLDNIRGLLRLVLRNCNISGEIPAYIWDYDYLQLLDTSFNQLGGGFPNYVRGKNLKFIFLSGNLLSGTIPDSLLKRGGSIDLSYNNFTWQGPEHSACQENMNRNVNLFRSSMENNLKGVLPCSKNADCPKYGCSFHVNCGGPDLTLKDRDVKAVYEGDLTVEGGTAKYYLSNNYWGFSSTGDFMDDNDFQNKLYTTSFSSREVPELYTTARLSPLSLTYFRYCLEDGNYSVNLHFAEIQFTNDGTYNSLGRRFFDIYIQGNLVWKDFNIEDAAHGAQKPVIKEFSANVTNSILEIRFDWAGKGTTRIPYAGSYGPLVSAISVLPSSRTCSEVGKKRTGTVFIILGSVVLALVLVILVFLWWKRLKRSRQEKDFERLDLQTGSFSLKQIKAATNNFDSGNKIGEGGFGPVFKGLLPDGTTIAVKQLSSKSRQGNREFLNEIGMISCLQHPNLVKLHGCCIEEEQLLLVYEYMENNSLARALFGRENSLLKLDWQTRLTITIGIAKGLAFLHEESRFKIVHRDIKATNVLLDGHLNPKISDFGLARLDEEEKTHISTRVAGTVGYMAPEYALWGYLTYKADVYSFGVMVLEIVSGKSNSSYMPSNDYICLLDWAFDVHRSGNLMELVDEKLGSEVDTAEAERVVKVSLLCTNATPSVRPTMSEVVSMLEGTVPVPDVIPESSSFSEDLRFKSMKDFHQQRQSEASSQTLISASAMTRTETGSSQASTSDLYEINLQ